MDKQAAEDFDRILSALEELFDVFIIAYADSAEQAEQFTMYVCMYSIFCSMYWKWWIKINSTIAYSN